MGYPSSFERKGNGIDAIYPHMQHPWYNNAEGQRQDLAADDPVYCWISNKPLARLGFRNCRVLQSTSKSWLKIHIGDKCGGKQAEVEADMGEEAGGERERERERGAMSFLQFYSRGFGP